LTDSDFVGEALIKLSALCCGTGLDEWFDITYKGKYAGKVHLRSEWEAANIELA